MAELADGQNDNAPGNDENGGADGQANQEVVPVATLLLRQARRRGRHSWRNSRSFMPNSTSSVGRHKSCAPHSSNSAPCMAHMPRRRRALPESGS